MASESPNTEELSNQEESLPADDSAGNFQDEEIDPSAPTQYIEDDTTKENQVSIMDQGDFIGGLI